MSETQPLNPLILGGAAEGAALARAMAEAGMQGTISLAGATARPKPLALPTRIGGFGGAAGLAEYIRAEGVTHVIDATHPFAAQMSRNAAEACAATQTPLIALTRPAWTPQPGDTWTRVPDIAGAVAALDRPRARVFLAVGRMHLADFAARPQHRYLLRLVDPPKAPLPLPDAHAVIARGPFDAEADRTLLAAERIDLLVSKNSGGTGAYAKIAAANALGLEVIMIDRPQAPDRPETDAIADILRWLHAGTERGV